MKYILSLCIACCLYLSSTAQGDFGAVEPEYYFGINLIPQMNGMLITTVLVRPKNDSTLEVKNVDNKDFILQLQGTQTSKANPNKVNFATQYDINPFMVDSLWKLRYSEYPYETPGSRAPKGWAAYFTKPAPAQWKMLNTFGIERYSDICYGEDFFRLMQAVSNPAWLQQYIEVFVPSADEK